MGIYIAYLILAGIQVPLCYKKKIYNERKFDSKKYLIMCCVELICLAGLRGYTIGADTSTYLKAIDYYSTFSITELLGARLVYPFDFEIGYFMLTKFAILVGLGKTAFLFLIAAIIYIPLYSAIKKYSSALYISILCYFAFGFFSYSLGIFRQMIAISLIVFGWKYVIERKPIKYMLIIVIAMLFHTTAIVAVSLYVLYGMKIEKIVPFFLISEAIFFVFGRKFAMLAVKFFPKYAGYVGGKYDLSGGSYLMLIALNAILVLSYLYRNKNDAVEKLLISSLVMAVFLQILGYSMNIFGRIVPYCSIAVIFAIPNLLNKVNKKIRNLIAVMLIISLYAFVFMEFNGNKFVTPYYFFWN